MDTSVSLSTPTYSSHRQNESAAVPNTADLEDQENELVVLESILDTEQFIYNRNPAPEALISGQVQIDVELPKDFKIWVKTVHLPVPASPSSSAEPTFPETKTADISYLPPVTLLFTLPTNYPSAQAPLYTLQSNWLDRNTLSILCQSLDEIWSKSQGTVVLFSWITQLREETLNIIGCDKQLEVTLHLRRYRTLREQFSSAESASTASAAESQQFNKSRPRVKNLNNSSRHAEQSPGVVLDQRAVFLNSSVRDKEALFNFLVEYNKEREEIEFCKGYHTCEVCFTDKEGKFFVRLGCGHHFCKDCLSGCYSTHIREGGIDAVKCLAVRCTGVPTIAQVQNLICKELFDRYDSILLTRALEGMSDLIYCPRQQCGKPVIVEPNEKLAWCSHCLYRFCAICKMVYHGVEPCRFKSDEKQKLFEEYTNASKEEKILMEKTFGKKQMALLVESTLSEKYIEKQSKPCPHCKIPIEKFAGCNKVTCTKCGSYFCWLCLKNLDKGNPYFHFQDRQSICYNQLFENVPDSDSDEEPFSSDEEEEDNEFFEW